MNLETLSPGRYIVAVSGGVDSVVLLDLLSQQAGLELIVAHFDHGIRTNSADDAVFVASLAQQYGLPFETEREELGAGASEAAARAARYTFLNHVKDIHQAAALVTAHHQDDLIETALLNTLRGTKRRGLVSLQSTEVLKRPLLRIPKAEIMAYAERHNLQWREDSTNTDTNYRRNYVRKVIKNSLTPDVRRKIVEHLDMITGQNKQINELVDALLVDQPANEINKKLLNHMYLAEAYELAAGWLRINGVNFDENTIKRLVIGARTLENTSEIDLKDDYYSVVKRDKVVIAHR